MCRTSNSLKILVNDKVEIMYGICLRVCRTFLLIYRIGLIGYKKNLLYLLHPLVFSQRSLELTLCHFYKAKLDKATLSVIYKKTIFTVKSSVVEFNTKLFETSHLQLQYSIASAVVQLQRSHAVLSVFEFLSKDIPYKFSNVVISASLIASESILPLGTSLGCKVYPSRIRIRDYSFDSLDWSQVTFPSN